MRASFANFVFRLERSDSDVAAAIRLRSLVIFSLRTRRRRISGLRLGADMNMLLGSKAPLNKYRRKSCWKLEVFYVKLRGSAGTQKNGLAFCQPFPANPLI